MPRLQRLRVQPNPYHHIDHRGRPAGCVLHEIQPGQGFAYVGCEPNLPQPLDGRAPPRPGELRQPSMDRTFTFHQRAVEVPDSAYYQRAVRDGALLAADEPTARACGVEWVEPAVALSRAEEAAIERWFGTYNEMPAFAAAGGV